MFSRHRVQPTPTVGKTSLFSWERLISQNAIGLTMKMHEGKLMIEENL